jgi:peroxiredoxin
MPSLERLHRALGPEGLAVVTVSTDEDEAELERFVTERRLTIPVLKDPGGRVAASLYRTTGYPETFVLDREGRVVEHVVGPAEWDSPERLASFRRLLEGGASR